jgi:hypothetical protein
LVIEAHGFTRPGPGTELRDVHVFDKTFAEYATEALKQEFFFFRFSKKVMFQA